MLEPVKLMMLEVEIKYYLQKTAENVIEIGKRLNQAKELVPHGEWQNWLEKNFQLSSRSARNFMQVAERFGKTEINFRFQSTQLIAMLALPEGDEEKFIAEKSAEEKPVEDMTVKKLREEIKQWKMKAEKAESNFRASETASDIKDSQLEYLSEEYEKLQKTYKEESARLNEVLLEHADLLDEKDRLEEELKNHPIEIATEYPADYAPMKKQLAEFKARESTIETVSKLEMLFETLSNTPNIINAVNYLKDKNVKIQMLETLLAELKRA